LRTYYKWKWFNATAVCCIPGITFVHHIITSLILAVCVHGVPSSVLAVYYAEAEYCCLVMFCPHKSHWHTAEQCIGRPCYWQCWHHWHMAQHCRL